MRLILMVICLGLAFTFGIFLTNYGVAIPQWIVENQRVFLNQMAEAVIRMRSGDMLAITTLILSTSHLWFRACSWTGAWKIFNWRGRDWNANQASAFGFNCFHFQHYTSTMGNYFSLQHFFLSRNCGRQN